jgi:hypothetical protein
MGDLKSRLPILEDESELKIKYNKDPKDVMASIDATVKALEVRKNSISDMAKDIPGIVKKAKALKLGNYEILFNEITVDAGPETDYICVSFRIVNKESRRAVEASMEDVILRGMEPYNPVIGKPSRNQWVVAFEY